MGAVIGGVLGLAGSAMSAGAASDAADAQAQAAQASIKLQKDTTRQARIDAYPWALEGAQALYVYMDALGIPRPQTPILPDLTTGPLGSQNDKNSPDYVQRGSGNGGNQQNPGGQTGNSIGGNLPGLLGQFGNNTAQQPAATGQPGIPSPNNIPMTSALGFQKTPGYEFQLQQGTQGVLNSLSALGMKNSGKALKSLETFGQGLANQEYGNWLNRIAGVAGMGQTQTNTTNALSQNSAQNIGQTMQDAGQARASGYVGAANAWSNGFQQLGNAIGQTRW